MSQIPSLGGTGADPVPQPKFLKAEQPKLAAKQIEAAVIQKEEINLSNRGVDRILEEFRGSAISDRLTLANVQWVEGDEAIEIMSEQAIAKVQRVQNYLTKPAGRILEKYRFAAAGGWIAYGCAIDGGSGKVPYFKPAKPRKELKNGSLKTVKYETPQGYEALPILPCVDDETAAAIYQRHNVNPSEGETFWQVIWRCNLPIAITEGLKKALSLIEHGIAAIALRGITCWHKKGTDELHQAIAHFATPGRSIYIIFDQDEKLSTQRDCRQQILRLGTILEAIGCKVFIPAWDRTLGKGIDDVLFGRGADAQQWLNTLLQTVTSLNDYRRYGRVQAALATIEQLNALTYPVERKTVGDYLPKLPHLELGVIHVLIASMNSGKTTRIGADWVKAAIALGWNVLILSPLNSLGQQTAKDWGLPHVHDFGQSTEQQAALWSLVSSSHGVVLCPDSLHRLPEWFWQRPLLFVLDEANQTIDHQVQGDTLGSRWADILERWSGAARHAIETGAIVLSEASLPDRAVKFAQTITGCDRVRVFEHRKEGDSWDCTVFSGQASGFRAQLLQSVQQGDHLLMVTSSQREARRLERVLAKVAPDRKVVRVDSETNQQGAFNEFFETPDDWLAVHQPHVLILSPSAKSGISIQGEAPLENVYFSAVWGYFPALTTDTHLQLLGRYRPPVPRFIFVPPFITSSGDESLFNPRAIKRQLHLNLKGIAGVYGLNELLEAEESRAESLVRIETAVMDYLAVSKTVSGAQKSIAHDALVRGLEGAGHTVQCIKLQKDSQTVELWKAVQEELWREDAQAIASAQVEPNHTSEWAHSQLESLEVSKEVQILAHKVLWREEFPGVLFNDAEECYEILCKDYGAMRRGVLLQGRAENLDAAKEGDRAAAESILKANIRAAHRLPKNYLRALLIAKTGILELINGQAYSNTDPRAIAVKKAALYWANEISYWLRLQIKSDQTPVEICNKLLRKLDLTATAIARPGKRGEKRNQIWTVAGHDNLIRVQLLEALRRKLSSSVSPICKDLDQAIQINDTSQPPPKNQRFKRRNWGVVWQVEAIDGDFAIAYPETGCSAGILFRVPLCELEAIAS